MSENGNEDPIERLVSALETIITTKIKIQEEKSYSNHREVWKLREQVYDPAREELKNLLREIVKPDITEKM